MKGNRNFRQSLAPLYEREYRFFLLSRFFYVMSLRMVSTVVAYQLFQITRSSFAIGLVGLSEFIPVFSLALYAGHVIDRTDKRSLLVKCLFYYSLCVGALIVITSSWFSPRIDADMTEMLFYVIIFVTGIIRAFAGPTSHAIIAQLVSRPVLHLAANLNSSVWLAGSIIGHASAGFFIAWFGVNETFYIILAYMIVAALVLRKISPKPIAGSNVNQRTWESVRQGLVYVYRNKILLGAISLDLFAVLFGGAIALIPEFAERILQVGPIGFGWLNAAADIGSVITIIAMTVSPMKRQQGRRLLFAVGGFGICVIIFGISTWYWLSFIALLIAGMFDGISVIVRGTILQLTTPDHMRGRVSAVNSMFINSSNELGQFESGTTARIMGASPAVVFGGLMTMAVVIFTWIKAPSLKKFEY